MKVSLGICELGLCGLQLLLPLQPTPWYTAQHLPSGFQLLPPLLLDIRVWISDVDKINSCHDLLYLRINLRWAVVALLTTILGHFELITVLFIWEVQGVTSLFSCIITLYKGVHRRKSLPKVPHSTFHRVALTPTKGRKSALSSNPHSLPYLCWIPLILWTSEDGKVFYLFIKRIIT